MHSTASIRSGVRMLQWITLARSWHPVVRIGIATIAVAAATAVQLPVEVIFPGQPFLLYFVTVVASASVLGRTAGFVAVAETSIASLLFYECGKSEVFEGDLVASLAAACLGWSVGYQRPR